MYCYGGYLNKSLETVHLSQPLNLLQSVDVPIAVRYRL